ncbi:VTT domain-containing protein [Aquabacterium sp. A7-Y]|uniref:VTT domain-containing protein n=1 Tax=Aquabacterium sp. A7-Y TaxID=1349605 RepID=UPI00223CB451|nr:VTT domain-containing protein [Aquabacterium sp. A7-Y]MCW7539818.1 VTT domain-containing protein [Aquabacterium sp. A7-Y]
MSTVPQVPPAREPTLEPGPSPVLEAGRNCWRIEPAERLAFLIDGQAYFSAVRSAVAQARRSIFILGWDIDSRMRLVPEGANDGLPEPLGDFLDAVVARGNGIQAHVLSWDFAMLFALEREWLTTYKLDWRTHRHLRFRLDDRHPFGASHHQKVVVVDDRVAFVGGFDLTRCRWDTSEHACGEPLRIDPDGKPYGPFHDVGVIVEGPVAAALGELARERWCRATGQRLKPPQAAPQGPSPWPPRLQADLEDVRVAVARTEPRFDSFDGVDEIRLMHQDAIASARSHIYIENQYFSSAAVGAAIAQRLAEPEGPDVVVVTPQRESGWLEESTMGVLRSRLHRRLAAADVHRRFRAYCPQIPELGKQCLNVHSKVMTVDDELFSVGSANISNRSMGFDTECNLVVEAAGQADAAAAARVRAAVALLRNRLLAEHLDVAPDRVAAALRQFGRLNAAIESLRQEGRRTLAPSRPEVAPELEALLPEQAFIDPEAPLQPDRFVAQFVPKEAKPRVSRRTLAIAAAVFGLGTLAAAWRVTPLQGLLDLDVLMRAAEQVREHRLAPLLTLLAYVLAGLVAMPVTALIAVTGIVFGPTEGLVYAVMGSLLSAAVTYGIGRALGRELVRRFAGRRINRLSRVLAHRGVVAMTVVRLLPVAPFTLVNVVAGASHIGLRDYLLGTFLGMAPGICMTVLFIDRVTEAVRDPGLGSFALLAVVVALVVAGAILIHQQVSAREPAR